MTTADRLKHHHHHHHRSRMRLQARAPIAVYASITVVVLVMLATMAAAEPGERLKPMPVPSNAGICPSGYSSSSGGMCVPHSSTNERAIVKPTLAPCPGFMRESMGFCLEKGR